MDDDKEVGKRTSVVILGRRFMGCVYYFNGILAAIFLAMATSALPFWVSAGWLTYFAFHTMLWSRLHSMHGKDLNDVLKWTSIIMFLVSCYLVAIFASLKPDPNEFFFFS